MVTEKRLDGEPESNGISSAFFGVVAILFFLAALFKPMSPDTLAGICYYLGCGFSSVGLSLSTSRLYEKVVFRELFEKVSMPVIPAMFYMLSMICFGVAAFLFALRITR